MKVALYDSDALLMSFRKIYKPNLKSKLFFQGYILSLKNLEMFTTEMDPSHTYNIILDNMINWFIGNKLVNDLYEAHNNNDKDLENKTIELFKKEIKRINEYISNIKVDGYNDSKLTREDAKKIMLEYMSEEELNNEILEIYLENAEELNESNQHMHKIVDKLNDGSIVRNRVMIRTIVRR